MYNKMTSVDDIKALSTLQILGEQIKDLVERIDVQQVENNELKDKVRLYRNKFRLYRYLLVINGVLCGYAMSHILC